MTFIDPSFTVHGNTLLTRSYFSREYHAYIQKRIQQAVYMKTHLRIGEQDTGSMSQILLDVFNVSSSHTASNDPVVVRQEMDQITKQVLAHVVPMIVNNIYTQKKYESEFDVVQVSERPVSTSFKKYGMDNNPKFLMSEFGSGPFGR